MRLAVSTDNNWDVLTICRFRTWAVLFLGNLLCNSLIFVSHRVISVYRGRGTTCKQTEQAVPPCWLCDICLYFSWLFGGTTLQQHILSELVSNVTSRLVTAPVWRDVPDDALRFLQEKKTFLAWCRGEWGDKVHSSLLNAESNLTWTKWSANILWVTVDILGLSAQVFLGFN